MKRPLRQHPLPPEEKHLYTYYIIMDKQTTIARRTDRLRRLMAETGISAFVIPTLDPHNSEYLPARWAAREWLTGFTGSAGTAVVTCKAAALWTDSRYFLQAEEQLSDTPFMLMREGEEGTPSISEWLLQQTDAGSVTGFFDEMMTADLYESLFRPLLPERQAKACPDRLLDTLWTDRPALPSSPITIHPVSCAGRTAAAKLKDIRTALCGKNGNTEPDLFLMNDLSEIAWTLNLRGADIAYNPFFIAYLAVTREGGILFCDPARLSAEVKRHLAASGIRHLPYDGWGKALEDAADMAWEIHMPATMGCNVTKFCDRKRVEYSLIESPVPALRAIKNEAETAGFRRAMERDGVAMVRFLRWLDESVGRGGESEMSADARLTALRAEQERFCGLSFPTIAGYGPHGAIVHYEADEASDAPLKPEGLLLLDSGAQYEDGTTDITRTIALGPVSKEERHVYTLVLKGHIALSRCRFPEGTTGLQLDTAARYCLWQEGYDFGHGTGHGVGSRLGVHEGPHQIRKNVRACTLLPLQAGMTVTDEPGIYVRGRFGVRIENTLLVREAGATEYGRFLTFEPLTLCPIDLHPVDRDMLTPGEKEWLNDYHRTVRRRLLPLLTDEGDRRWLEQATQEV